MTAHRHRGPMVAMTRAARQVPLSFAAKSDAASRGEERVIRIESFASCPKALQAVCQVCGDDRRQDKNVATAATHIVKDDGPTAPATTMPRRLTFVAFVYDKVSQKLICFLPVYKGSVTKGAICK